MRWYMYLPLVEYALVYVFVISRVDIKFDFYKLTILVKKIRSNSLY